MQNPSVEYIGRALALERDARDWSRRDIARRADGIGGEQFVRKAESGEMSMRTLIALANALGVRVEYVLQRAWELENAGDLRAWAEDAEVVQ